MDYEEIYHEASDDESLQYEEESDSDLEPVDLDEPRRRIRITTIYGYRYIFNKIFK